jgi:hypothetical protein
MNVENFKTRGGSLALGSSPSPTRWPRRLARFVDLRARCDFFCPVHGYTDAFADALAPDPPATNADTVDTKVKKEKKSAKTTAPTEGKVDVQNFKSFGGSGPLAHCLARSCRQ